MLSDKKSFKVAVMGDNDLIWKFLKNNCLFDKKKSNYRFVNKNYEFYFSPNISCINELYKSSEKYDAGLFFTNYILDTIDDLYRWKIAFYKIHDIKTPCAECYINDVHQLISTEEYINSLCLDNCTIKELEALFESLGNYICENEKQMKEIEEKLMKEKQSVIESNYITDLFTVYKKCNSEKIKVMIEELIVTSIVNESLDNFKKEHLINNDNMKIFEEITKKNWIIQN